ncbi:lipase [Candidatus Saccharibacteria bacterium]|nr:lipase [Candidatus Saccharibacteria bacterium]
MSFVRKVQLSCLTVILVSSGALFAGRASAQPLVPPVDLGQIQSQLQAQLDGALDQLPKMGDFINPIVPPPNPPQIVGETPPIAQIPQSDSGEPMISEDLYALMQPSPVGDAFFDEWPADLASYANGEIIGNSVEVTAKAEAFFPTPGGVRVYQFKFKTTDSSGADSYATASLVVPNTPWTGSASRPVLVDEKPIDALGRACTPSYTLKNGLNFATNPTDFIPPASQAAVLRNYAVLIPDHEGPRMSYAEPVVAGRITLDAIRAMQQFDPKYGDSAMVVNGYSGGAIATRGTALEVASYAPELAKNIKLAVMGGNPIDYQVLSWSMDGPANLASGIFHGATIGYLRSHPQGFLEANNAALQLIMSPYKDACVIGEALIGTLIPTWVLTNDGDPYASDFAQKVFQEQRDMMRRKSAVPLFIFNGAHEFWIPSEPARRFAKIQCEQGVAVTYGEYLGEHGIAALTAIPDQFTAIDRTLQSGIDAPTQNNCASI